MKILFLEDDKWFADSIAAFLRDDFDVRICADPEGVFAVLEDWKPDLLLADVLLGTKNLFLLLSEMQSYVDTRKLNVVILSSVASRINPRDVEKFNVKDVLDKSEITPEILRSVINNSCHSEPPTCHSELVSESPCNDSTEKAGSK